MTLHLVGSVWLFFPKPVSQHLMPLKNNHPWPLPAANNRSPTVWLSRARLTQLLNCTVVADLGAWGSGWSCLHGRFEGQGLGPCSWSFGNTASSWSPGMKLVKIEALIHGIKIVKDCKGVHESVFSVHVSHLYISPYTCVQTSHNDAYAANKHTECKGLRDCRNEAPERFPVLMAQ